MGAKSVKRVYIEPGCISCGTCESICPKVFKVTDVAHVNENVPVSSFSDEIREAADVCPVTVIKYEEK